MNPAVIIGVDIAANTYTWTPYFVQDQTYGSTSTVTNDSKGFEKLVKWLKNQNMMPKQVLLCLEDTGVYDDFFCYWMAGHGLQVTLEPPHKVKRAFQDVLQKTDELDSRQIAEYGVRFLDQLHLWTAPSKAMEHIQALLSTREQLTRQMTSSQNSLQMLQRKYIRTPLAEESLQKTIVHLKEQIQQIDREIKNQISKDPKTGPLHALITSVPGVGTLLASNLILMTNEFKEPVSPRKLASYMGISPFKQQSGTSK